MRGQVISTLLAAFVLQVAVADASPQKQRVYKWVDERGNVHFSDRVDAGSSGSIERLNANGIRVDQSHSATPRNQAERQQRAEQRRLAQLDTMLLATYSSELDLLKAHDNSRATMENSIRTTQGNILRLRQELLNQQSGAGTTVPGQSADTPVVAELRRQIASEEARLQTLQTRRFELHEQQNREVARFRELTMQDG